MPPPLEGPVTDPGRVLSEADKRALNNKLKLHKQTTGVGINIFIPTSLNGETIEDVSYETARAWKIGSGTTDNGVLLTWAPVERKVRIETGKGIGDRLTDVGTSHIIRDVISPKLKAGQNRQALEDGVDAIARDIGPATGSAAGKQTKPGAAGTSPGKALAGGALVLIILIGGGGLLFLVFLVFVLKKFFSSGRRDPNYYAHHHDPYVQNNYRNNDYGSPGVFYTGGNDSSWGGNSDSGGGSDWGGGGDSGGGSDWGGGGDSGGSDFGGGGSSGDY